jgi:hypothetical protein
MSYHPSAVPVEQARIILCETEEYFQGKLSQPLLALTKQEMLQFSKRYLFECTYRPDLDLGPGSRCWLVFKLWDYVDFHCWDSLFKPVKIN